jgi:hypothetical protein
MGGMKKICVIILLAGKSYLHRAKKIYSNKNQPSKIVNSKNKFLVQLYDFCIEFIYNRE